MGQSHDFGVTEFFGWKFRWRVDYTDGCRIIYESVGPVPREVGEAFQYSMEQIKQSMLHMAGLVGEVGKDATGTEANDRAGDAADEDEGGDLPASEQ